MIVDDYMSHPVHSIGPGHSIAAAHRLMRRHNIRHLPVLVEGNMVGVLSQRDLYFLEALDDIDQERVSVSEAMEENVLSVERATPLSEVARTMIGSRVGCLIVMEDDKVCGIITTIDALMALWEMTDTWQDIQASP